MSIEQNRDGTFRFIYNLKVERCRWCDGTDIDLFENGGMTPDEHKKGTTEGGGICKQCGHTVMEQGIEPVPSMSMLLDIWNFHNSTDRL